MIDLSHTAPDTPFRATDIKIRRAIQHIRELEVVASAYYATEPVTIETKVSGNRVDWAMHAEGAPDVVSAIVGDVFHNLRTALDVLACELCRRHSGEGADKGVHFPFCGAEKDLTKRINELHFKRAGPEAVKLLKETIRPYPLGNAALSAIHTMDIQDKHYAIIPGVVTFATPAIRPTQVDGKLVIEVIGEPTKPTDLELVFMRDSPFGEVSLVPTLHKLVETTAGVVEAFKALSVPAG